jgi:predicted HAD superfamily phosphohydrolase
MFFFTDWEGPWVTTDFAYEATIAFFNNHEFFERLSQYDDYLSYIEKRRGYEAGDTLRLLAPFFVATSATSRELEELSKFASFVPDAREAMLMLMPSSKPVVVSTAYMQFLKSAEMIGVREIHGTEFRIDDYRVEEEEKKKILRAVDTIASLPEIAIKPGMKKEDVDENSRKSIEWLNGFFYELMKTPFGRIVKEVNAVGGERKKRIVQGYVERYEIEEPIAIGDSISDHAMLEWVKKRGIAIAFNGNEFAIKHANLAVVSNTAFGEAVTIKVFMESGSEGVRRLARDFCNLKPELARLLQNSDVKIYWLEDVDVNAVIEESIRMRKRLRGEAGKLG